MTIMSETEARLFEQGYLKYRDSQTTLEFQRAGIFAPPAFPARIFANVVVELRERGYDLESARFAAGQATMRFPEADYRGTLGAAVEVLESRKAA